MSHSFDTRATRRVWIWWPSLADGDPTESTDHDRSIARISHSSTVDWWRNYGRTRREWLESQHGRSEIPFRSALCIFRFGNQTISIITGAADSVCDRISGISSERRSRNFFFCFFFLRFFASTLLRTRFFFVRFIFAIRVTIAFRLTGD